MLGLPQQGEARAPGSSIEMPVPAGEEHIAQPIPHQECGCQVDGIVGPEPVASGHPRGREDQRFAELEAQIAGPVPVKITDTPEVTGARQRALAAADGRSPVSPRQVLEWATIEGARANGLEARVGTLTPGKQADVVLLRTDRLGTIPLGDPATAVVTGMDTGNVDTVLVAGRVLKRHGRLLHVDWPALMAAAAEARDRVVARSGFRLPKI